MLTEDPVEQGVDGRIEGVDRPGAVPDVGVEVVAVDLDHRDLALPEGDFWVHVYDETYCTPFQTGLLYVEEDLTIAVTRAKSSA